MVTVDAKGRVVLPQEIRERLGITPGTEVEVRSEDGRAVVEPEEDPDGIVADLDRLVEEATRSRAAPERELIDADARRHVEAIRRQRERADRE